jgi:nicotinate-nucleotide adenylyltransferase
MGNKAIYSYHYLSLHPMKIGLFFGSFNPVHCGHMVIANYMAEFAGLEKVWFVVSPHNPLKKKESLLSNHHRIRLVREAIGDDTRMKASNIEFSLPQPSYTVNTLAYLHEKFPKHSFALIMGSDNLESLDKWKNYEQILGHYEIYVYPRPGHDGGKFINHPKVKMTDTPLMDVSSTFIRNAISEGRDVRHFLPESVWKFIREMHFYE